MLVPLLEPLMQIGLVAWCMLLLLLEPEEGLPLRTVHLVSCPLSWRVVVTPPLLITTVCIGVVALLGWVLAVRVAAARRFVREHQNELLLPLKVVMGKTPEIFSLR